MIGTVFAVAKTLITLSLTSKVFEVGVDMLDKSVKKVDDFVKKNNDTIKSWSHNHKEES